MKKQGFFRPVKPALFIPFVFATAPDSAYRASQDKFWPLLINPKEFPPNEDGSHNIPVEEFERLKAVEHILVNEISNLPDWDVIPFFDGTYLVRRGDKLKSQILAKP